MSKLKVVTIVGTRPEIIRLCILIPKLDQFTNHVLVHTGQNNDKNLNDVFFRDLDLRAPDYYLNVDTSSMGSVLGDTIKKAEAVFREEVPDAVLILGDTNSAIAAVVAERMGIPVYHMEAGNRSFDANVPEELNRRLVDHVATFNLPYNSHSRHNLLNEGIHPRFICVTGSPLREVINRFSEKIKASVALNRMGLASGSYILASIHRQENVDSRQRLTRILEELQRAGEAHKVPVIVSTHPRTRLRLDGLETSLFPDLRFAEPFGYFDYNKLQIGSLCVVSDSGTIFEEASLLGFRAVCLRDSTERVESLGASSVLMNSIDWGDLAETIRTVLDIDLAEQLPEGYEVSDFSFRVLNFVISTAKLASKWKNLLP